METVLVKHLRKGLEEGVFTCGVAAVSTGGKKGIRWVAASGGIAEGKAKVEELFFDLASLTKPLATVLLVMDLVSCGVMQLTDSLKQFFSEVPGDKSGITIHSLLCHRSGLPAHRKMYLEKRDVISQVLDEPLLSPPGREARYSDLGYILLGKIIEQLTGTTLDRLVEQRIYAPLGLEGEIFFGGKARHPERRYVPTEECPWRGRVLQGEVSDENCFAMKGVAGHAGLFGTLHGVTSLCEEILDTWKQRQSHLAGIPAEILALFLKRQHNDATWALGFDTRSPEGSSAGRHLSLESVGHLGFTGTSFWIDPQQDLIIVLLTNRVHPTRANDKIKAFRPWFHDRVVEAFQANSG